MKSFKKYISSNFFGLWDTFNAVLVPQICPGCNNKTVDRSKSILCTFCWQEIPYTDHFSKNYINSVHEKFFGKFNLEFGAALWYFNQKGITGSIIHQYKYKKKKYLGNFISAELCRALDDCSFLPQFDLVTSIPIHASKFNQRGYNQSSVIAEHIGNHLGIETDTDLLVKIIETESQTKKNRKDRLLNIANSIVIREDKINSIIGKKVLIIDDTLTTGATIETCGKILLQNGIKSVSIICICQAT